MQAKLPERHDLLGGWLHSGQAAMIWAPAGVGKTWLSMDISLAVAGGGSLGSWEAPGNHRVLIIDGEMDPHDMQSRFAQLLERKDASVQKLARDNIILLPRTYGQNPEEPFVCLTDQTHREALTRDIIAIAPDLVVLDNVSTLTLGSDTFEENDAGAIGPINEMILKLKGLGIATLIIHHANKGGQNFRGSSALMTTFDYVIGLTRPDDVTLPVGRAAFKLDFNKDRSGNPAATQSSIWELGEFGWYCQAPQADAVEQLVSLVKTHRYVSQQDLADRNGIPKATVSERLKKARVRGLLPDDERAECFKRAQEIREEAENPATEDDFDPALDGTDCTDDEY